MNILVRLVLNAIALLIVAYLVPGFEVSSFYTALIVALVLGLVNAVIKPILLVLTLPITVLTFGLFALVINIFLFWFVQTFVKGFVIHDFSALIVGWLVYTVLGTVINSMTKQ